MLVFWVSVVVLVVVVEVCATLIWLVSSGMMSSAMMTSGAMMSRFSFFWIWSWLRIIGCFVWW